jgi:hypothetical protein
MTEKQVNRDWPTYSDAKGIDAAYEKERAEAVAKLHDDMAGPKRTGMPPDGDSKNPEGEFERPAPMDIRAKPEHPVEPGPNGPGNSKGDGTIDPQGQQGGTHGGQPGRPLTPRGPDASGTPLETAEERRHRSMPQRGSGFGS